MGIDLKDVFGGIPCVVYYVYRPSYSYSLLMLDKIRLA